RHARRDPRHGHRHGLREADSDGRRHQSRRSGRAAVPRACAAAHARSPARLREARGGGRQAAARGAARRRRERARDSHLHPASDGLMAWRASHYAAAGALALGALGWAAREAWSGRRPITAPPIRVDRAYVGYVEALGRRETLADPLARAGIVGRDYSALLAAATHLPVRRLRAGLVFQFRRLATDSVADRVAVRLSPERLVRLESPEGERRFGRILAAAVDVGRTPSYAYLFVPDSAPQRAGYYDEQGRSLKRAFLRAPLQFRRVSSRFRARYHPILHAWRQHEGGDFSAAYGTPVRATADGIVTEVGREEEGYGNLI